MAYQMRVDMEILRDIHWEKHLVQMANMREAFSTGGNFGR